MYSDIDANMIPDEVSLLIHVQGRFHFMTMFPFYDNVLSGNC